MKNYKTPLALLGLLIILSVVYAIWKQAALPKSQSHDDDSSVVCTLDARQCPDGSWVGRSGPNCEFVCPLPTSSSTVSTEVKQVGLSKSVMFSTLIIRPTQVLEDSRCPIDVQCIQAGTVRVETTLSTGAQQVFKLNTPVTIGDQTITLIAVRPEKESKKTIKPTDYIFTFRSE